MVIIVFPLCKSAAAHCNVISISVNNHWISQICLFPLTKCLV